MKGGEGNQGPSGKKINLLQKKLDEWFGKGTIDITKLDAYAYNVEQGASNRNKHLCKTGQPLKHLDYPGAILPSNCE